MRSSGSSSALRDLTLVTRDEDGATAMEFGLVLPSLMLTIYGILEFGRTLFVQGMLLFATEEATRFATVNFDATVAEIQAVAESHLILVDPDRITEFAVSSDVDPNDQTKLVSVEITYAHAPLLPMPWDAITLIGNSKGFIVDE